MRPLVERLAALIAPYDVDVVCGPLVGGAFLAQAIATELHRAFSYTERYIPGAAAASAAGGLTGRRPMYQAQYLLPKAFSDRVRSRKIAIVDDVMSAGSAAMATFRELQQHGAKTVVVAALMALGNRGAELFANAGIPVEAAARREFQLWLPEDCPLCMTDVPLVRPG